jgi:hypothetical protein
MPGPAAMCVGISVSPKVEGRRAREFEASDDEPAEKSNAIRTGSDRPSPGNFPTARNVLGYRVTKALRGVQETSCNEKGGRSCIGLTRGRTRPAHSATRATPTSITKLFSSPHGAGSSRSWTQRARPRSGSFRRSNPCSKPGADH